MELDRQAIERKDFPIGRRGYDPTRSTPTCARSRVGSRSCSGPRRRGSRRVARVVGGQPGAEHPRGGRDRCRGDRAEATEDARQVARSRRRDAERTREEALETARAHVAAVAQVAATLLERVGSMDAEVARWSTACARAPGTLAADLPAVEGGMARALRRRLGPRRHGRAAVRRRPRRPRRPPAAAVQAYAIAEQAQFEADARGRAGRAAATAAPRMRRRRRSPRRPRPRPAPQAAGAASATSTGRACGAQHGAQRRVAGGHRALPRRELRAAPTALG